MSKFWWDYDSPEERWLHSNLESTRVHPESLKKRDRTFMAIYLGLMLMSAAALYFFINEKPPQPTDVSNTTRAVTR